MYYNISSPKNIENLKAFDDNVIKKKKSFLLIVTAPWCYHCQQFKKNIWNKKKVLGETLQSKGFSKSVSVDGDSMAILDIEESIVRHLTSEHKEHPLSKILLDNVSGYPTVVYMKYVGSNWKPRPSSKGYVHGDASMFKSYMREHLGVSYN